MLVVLLSCSTPTSPTIGGALLVERFSLWLVRLLCLLLWIMRFVYAAATVTMSIAVRVRIIPVVVAHFASPWHTLTASLCFVRSETSRRK